MNQWKLSQLMRCQSVIKMLYLHGKDDRLYTPQFKVYCQCSDDGAIYTCMRGTMEPWREIHQREKIAKIKWILLTVYYIALRRFAKKEPGRPSICKLLRFFFNFFSNWTNSASYKLGKSLEPCSTVAAVWRRRDNLRGVPMTRWPRRSQISHLRAHGTRDKENRDPEYRNRSTLNLCALRHAPLRV